MGIFGRDVTVVVDVANVMGSRPDGWWRDRAGAAIRLHDQIVRLAASGRAILPGDDQSPDERGEHAPAFVLVLEGAARAAVPRLPPAKSGAAKSGAAETGAAETGPLRPGEVRVVEARGSGDDTIVAVVHELPGRRLVVTADRELRARCAAAGAELLGPGWLLGLLPRSQRPRGPGD
jgi:8-oxo-dGTP diphosphatase